MRNRGYIAAAGFAVGETVEFQVLHTDGTANTGNGHAPWEVADGDTTAPYVDGNGIEHLPDLDGVQDGNVQTTWFVDSDDSANSTFELTANGLTSHELATTTFTDAPNPNIGNLSGDSVNYTEQGTAVIIDQGTAATLTGGDGNYTGGSLVVSYNSGGGQTGDTLGFGAGVTISGSDVIVGGLTIGTFSGGTNGTTLTVSFANSNANDARVQTVIRNINFGNQTDGVVSGNRVVKFVLDDGAKTNNTDNVTATIVVTGVNDAPTLTVPASFTVTENVAGDLLYTGSPFVDADSASLTVTLTVSDGTITGNAGTGITVGGTATARTFAGTTANLNSYFTTAGKITYTTAQDNTTARTLTTSVSDGSLSNSADSTITITGVNDPPTLGAVTSGSIAEVDQSASTTDSGLSGTLTGADVDVETLTYGISTGTLSMDTLTVSKVGTYGTLTVTVADGSYSYAKNTAAIEALDAGETPSDVFTVTVSDGNGPAVTQTYTVNLTGADDPPTLAAVTSGSIAEVDQSASTTDSGLSGTLAGADVDVETLTYGISTGTLSMDTLTVSKVGTYGTLTVTVADGSYSYAKNTAAIEALDAGETPSDVFTVTVSDGDGPAVTQTYTVNLTGADDAPVNSAPVINSLPTASVLENTATTVVVLDVNATDAESPPQTLTYSLSGTDAGDFTINSLTGEIKFAAVPNSEAPADADLDNIYHFTVTVTDNGSPVKNATQAVTITVTNVIETPGTTLVSLAAGVLTVTDIGAVTNDALTISLDANGNIVISDPTHAIGVAGGANPTNDFQSRVPLTSVTQLVINTGLGSDQLTIDFTNGNPIPSGGLNYNGGDRPRDTLVLKNLGTPFSSTTYRPTTINNGSFLFVPKAPLGSPAIELTFSHLGGVTLEGTEAAELSFDLP